MESVQVIAQNISIQLGKTVLTVKDRDIWVIDEFNTYTPSDHIYQNKFLGKMVDPKYITGGNFQQIEEIMSRQPKFSLILPHDFKDFQIMIPK